MHDYHRSDPLDPARGIAMGLWLSLPLWLTVALIVVGLRAAAQ